MDESRKVDIAYKAAVGKVAMSGGRAAYEETMAKAGRVLPSQVWYEAGKVPAEPPGGAHNEVTGVVRRLDGLVLSQEPGKPNAWHSPELVGIIDPATFGEGYAAVLKDGLGNIVLPGTGEYEVFYDSGAVVFEDGYAVAEVPLSISCYVYAGQRGLPGDPMEPHEEVWAATAGPLAAVPDGTGPGKTLTAEANGAIVADGEALTVGQRLLAKDEPNPVDNGLYTVTVQGDAGTPFVLTRAADFDGSPEGEVSSGDSVFVMKGAENASLGFTLLAFEGKDPVVDTDPMVWALSSNPGSFEGGSGIDITGTSISVDAAAVAGTGLEQRAGEGNGHILDVAGYTPLEGATVPRRRVYEGVDILDGATQIYHDLGTMSVDVTVFDSNNDEVWVGVKQNSPSFVTIRSHSAFTGRVCLIG